MEPVLLVEKKTLAGGGGAGSSWQDSLLWWIPLAIFLLLWAGQKWAAHSKKKSAEKETQTSGNGTVD